MISELPGTFAPWSEHNDHAGFVLFGPDGEAKKRRSFERFTTLVLLNLLYKIPYFIHEAIGE